MGGKKRQRVIICCTRLFVVETGSGGCLSLYKGRSEFLFFSCLCGYREKNPHSWPLRNAKKLGRVVLRSQEKRAKKKRKKG